MLTYKRPPLVRNAKEPNLLFTDTKLEIARDFLNKRPEARAKTPSQELETLNRIFGLASFNGFYATGIDEFGKIIWVADAEPMPSKHLESDYDPRGVGVVVTITRCISCKKDFRAYHYDAIDPEITCPDCKEKVDPGRVQRLLKMKSKKLAKELPIDDVKTVCQPPF